MFEGCILVFKNVLNAKLLPLQARLGAWAVSEGTRKGLLRSGHWGDPPPIRWQDVNPNPVHTKTCGVGGGGGRRGSHETSTTALTLPRVLVCAAPQVGPAGRPGEGGAGAPAALRASVANPAARPPARRSGPYHASRISAAAADRKRRASPTRHPCNGAPRPPRPGSPPPLSPAASRAHGEPRLAAPRRPASAILSCGSRHPRTRFPDAQQPRVAPARRQGTE